MRIARLPQSLIDLVDVAGYLGRDEPSVADEFFDAFEATLELLRSSPKIGSPRVYRSETRVRMSPIRGFPRYLIFYTENPEEIVLLRVIHASRDYNRFDFARD